MSNDNFEYGTLQFTKTGYNEIMRNMRSVFNERQDFFYDLAVSLYDVCLKKKIKHQEMYFSDLQNFSDVKKHSRFFAQSDDGYEIMNEIFRGKNNNAICKPRKSAFNAKKLTNKVSSFTIDIEDGSITFNATYNTIGWKVDENNNAVESAHDDCMAREFFSILGRYKWRRKEGGVFLYSDEYAGGECEHSRPESISHYFGPLGEKRRITEHKLLEAYYRRM